MKSNFSKRLLFAAVLATTAPLVLTSTTALAGQNQDQRTDQRTDKEKAREKASNARQQATAARQEARQQQAEAGQHQRQADATSNQDERQRHLEAAQGAREQQMQAEQRARNHDIAASQATREEARMQRERAQAADQSAQRDRTAERERAQAADRSAQQARDQARADRQRSQIAAQAARTDARNDRQVAQVSNQAARTDARNDRQTAQRLSKARQEQVIATQKQRVSSYRSWQNAQHVAARQAAVTIQNQNRSAQYAYIVDYNNRLWQQQQRYATTAVDYYNDPYFYSAPSYRYSRDGAWYTTNQYGANLLQQAVNDGYGEGYRSGHADRLDGWRPDYHNSWVYQNASYGYSGYYMDRGEYSYYFRQGFQRGYQDGYYSRYQYGAYRGGSYSILGTVVSSILGLQPYAYNNTY